MNYQKNFRIEIYSASNEPSPVDVVIGARLRLARMMRGLSSADVLACTAIPRLTLQKIERGEIRAGLEALRLLCDAYRIELGQLFAPDTEKHSSTDESDPILTLFDDVLRGQH